MGYTSWDITAKMCTFPHTPTRACECNTRLRVHAIIARQALVRGGGYATGCAQIVYGGYGTRTSLNVWEGGVFGIVGMGLVQELYVGHKHYGNGSGEWACMCFACMAMCI
jgi:hypothetical protein